MDLLDRRDRYGAVSVALHWGLAGSMITAWICGQLGDPREARELFLLHHSFGLLALGFAVLLVLWRLFVRRPEPVTRSPLETVLARIVQAGLPALAVAAPLAGIVALQSAGRPVQFFGVEILSGSGAAGPSGELDEAAEEVHELLVVPLFLLLLGLHVAGVVKHHLVDRVPVLRRMLGRPAAPAAV